FDPDGVAELVELFLPTLLSEAPLNIELTAAALGIPYVPKVRAVERLGDEGRYLGFFFKLCTPDQINDTTDALCYEELGSGSAGNSLKRLDFRIKEASDKGDGFWVEIESPELNPSDLDVSYRLHAGEPWQSFRSLGTDGTLHVDHPALYFPGAYDVFFRIRDKNRPGLWSEVRSTHVLIDKAAPVLKAWRQGNEVRWHVQDDATAAERIKIKAEVLYAGERRVHDFALREMLEVHPQASVRLWAMDAKGHVSTAVFLDGQPLEVAAGQSTVAYGCQSHGPQALSFLFLMLLLMPLVRISLRKTTT
ncbi:MAG: hypothetical protein QGI45_14195, partial [Myxococcota bacterium]|nr:hypothetical protein [Myxococcota bacterium]